MRRFRLAVFTSLPMTWRGVFITIIISAIMMAFPPTPVMATPLTQVTTWGTADLNCDNEHANCTPPDPYFTNGYRAGGEVSWIFNFDPTPFASISDIQLQVVVVGFWGQYPGNIDPNMGQIGDYLAIDGVPFAPFLNMTDGRDTRTFDLTLLSAGIHTFTVVAYSDPNAWYEGWGGIDVATITVTGEATGTSVPEPTTMFLLGLGLIGLAGVRRKLKQ